MTGKSTCDFRRLAAGLLGPLLLWTTRREEKRLAGGRTYEPDTFIERRNWRSAWIADARGSGRTSVETTYALPVSPRP